VDQGEWIREALAECPPYVSDSLRRLLPELDQPADTAPVLDDEWWRQRLFSAVGTTLGTLTTVRPLAVLVEDLHWADSTTLDLLEHMVTRDPGVAVVGTWRLDDPATGSETDQWFTRVRRLSSVALLELAPLDRPETAGQLEILLHRPADPDMLDRIYRRSRGQPLFTEQLAAHQAAERELPQLLADLLDQRLDGLQDIAWSISRDLGIADRPLTDAQLRATTNLEAPALTAGLRELAAHHLLADTPSAHEVRLRHPLLAEAIRRRLVPGEASDVHRRLAGVLGTTPDVAPAEVAAHWQAADDSGQELTWRIAAARAASSRFAARQAAEEWLRVVELWPQSAQPGEIDLTEVYCMALESLITADERPRAAVVGREAMARLPEVENERTAQVYAHVARGVDRTDLAEARALVNRAIRVYESLPPSRGHVLALDQLAGYLTQQGQPSAARRAVARAVEISADLGDTALRRRMLITLAWHEVITGRPEDAVARAGDAAQMTPRMPDPVTELIVAMYYTDILLITGAPAEQVEAAGRRGLDAASEFEVAPNLVSVVRSNTAQALIDAGRVDRVAALLDPVTGGEVVRRTWAEHLERAYLDFVRGDYVPASQRFTRLFAVATTPQMQRWIAERSVVVDLWEGRAQIALDRMVEALDGTHIDKLALMGEYYLLAARAAADAAEQTGPPKRRRELRQQLDELRFRARIDPLGPDSPSRHRRAWLRTWNAQLARLAHEDTVELWVSAASAWDALPRPFEAAYCRWRAALVVLRTERAGLAAKLLNRAERDAREHVPLRRAIAATKVAANRRAGDRA